MYVGDCSVVLASNVNRPEDRDANEKSLNLGYEAEVKFTVETVPSLLFHKTTTTMMVMMLGSRFPVML